VCYGPYDETGKDGSVSERIYRGLKHVLETLKGCEYLDGKRAYLTNFDEKVEETSRLLEKTERIIKVRGLDEESYIELLKLCLNTVDEITENVPNKNAGRAEWLMYYQKFIDRFDQLSTAIQQTYYKALYRRS
jgi:hypothetical protein